LDQITVCLDPICEELKKKSIKIDTLTKFMKRLKEPDKTKIAELSGLNYDFKLLQKIYMFYCSTVQKLKCNTGIAKIFNRICVNLDNRDIENTLNRKPGVMAIGNKKVINLDTLIVTDRVQSDNFSHCTKTKYIENFDPNSDEYKFCVRYYLDLFCNDIEVLQTYLNIMKTSMYGKKIRNFHVCISIFFAQKFLKSIFFVCFFVYVRYQHINILFCIYINRLSMEQVKRTLTQKERNKANIKRYKEKDPVKYNTLVCEAKKRYYEKTKRD
jgi:hypothetical protein